MRIASPFQRRTRPWKRLRGVLSAGACGAAVSLGCFFELGDVVPLEGIGGAGSGGASVAGDGGTVAGGEPIGGLGGDGGTIDAGCMPGFKRCGEQCVAITTESGCGRATCDRCATPLNSVVTCNADTGQCQVSECTPGFADCDGDTASYTGDPGSNGCEYSFGPQGEVVAEPPAELSVTERHINIADGAREDWAGVPAYPLLATCENCSDNTQIDVIAKNEVPARRDLDAYFRVAWDRDFFYVLGDVYDNQLISDGTELADGRCQTGAPCEDGLTLFVDGRDNRAESPSYSNDDFRIFASVGNKAFRVSGEQLDPPRFDLKATVVGAACYRLEAQFAWPTIVQTQNDQAIDGLFPPIIGQSYGFDISVNDWERAVSTDVPQRESQLFWLSPGENYHQVTSGFGAMTLAGPLAPPSQPQ